MSTWNRAIIGNNVSVRQETAATQIAHPVKRILPPRLATILFGRADLFTRALQELEANETVVLHGMAGMGKSALASAIAWSLVEKYPNGVLWIDSGYSPVDAICDNVGQQLEDDQMPRLDAASKPARVRHLLGYHKVLIVLDDCWDADVARAFAQECVPAGYSLLVTCREKIARLGKLIEIPSLDHNAGIDLFRDASGLKTKKDEAEIQNLVHILGGHPQALVIAGAFCLEEELSARELLNMLGPAEERIKKLKLGKDTSNNVWATFELSYQRLRYEEQIVFKSFSGAWAKTATAELLSLTSSTDQDTVDSALRGLVKRALARVEDLADGRRRYAIHDLIHAFAQGLIKESGKSIDEVRNDWLNAVVLYTEKYQKDVTDYHNALEAELGNLMGAANWAAEHSKNIELDNLAYMLCASSNLLFYRGYNAQAVALLHYAVDAAQALGDKDREGGHLGNLGYAYALLSNYPQAIEYYKQALDIARSTNDTSSESKLLGLMGLAYDNISNYPEAIECYERAVDLERAIGNKIGEGRWLGSLAGTYRTLGDGAKATDLYTQAIELAQEMGDRANECVHISNLGNALRTWGKYKEAIEYYDQAFSIALEIGDRATQARCLVNTGRLLGPLGKPLEGLEKCSQAMEIFSEIGFKSGEAYAHGYIGEVLRTLGKNEEARSETLQALTIHREVGVQNGQGDWLHNLGLWALEDGNKDEGIDFLQEAHRIRSRLGIAKADDTLKVLRQAGADVQT